jgi:hypothetical protein
MSLFYKVIKLSNLYHYLAMNTLYYSLKKASQLAGVSQERICEWEQDESNDLAPAKNNSGAFLFSWHDIKVIQELKETMSLKKDLPAAANGSENDIPAKEKESSERQTDSGITSSTKSIIVDALLLPDSEDRKLFANPPFKAAKTGHIKADASAGQSIPDSDREDLIKTAEELSGLAREALKFQSTMDERQTELRVRPAFPDIHLASDPRHLSPRGLRFSQEESSFNRDLNEIREILQELHDRL